MSDSRSYSEIIERLETLRDEPARLHRVARFNDAFERLSSERGLAIDPATVILVAGTNGKGSVCKILETLLEKPGRSIGLFTSPHMMDTTERIRSEGRDLGHDEFVTCFRTVEPYAEGLSHFELLTLMAAETFFGGRLRRTVDHAIIEVGVGGRLDPTRSIPHGVSVITRIGLDHEELLGGSLELIAREKLAIVDPANFAIVAPFSAGVRPAFEDRRRETSAIYIEVPPAKHSVNRNGRIPTWLLHSKWGDAALSLKGARAAENALVALHVLEALGEDVVASLPRLARVEWPCRMEGFEIAGRDVYLSGDHNPQGAESLVEIVREFARPVVHFVVGLGRNKRIDEFMTKLAAVPGSRFHLTKTTFRGGELDRYGKWASLASSVEDDPALALRRAIDAAEPGELVVVTGSLYLAGDLRAKIVQGFFGDVKPIK